MNIHFNTRKLILLMAGDILTLLLVTVFGFATHGTVGTAGSRMLSTFLPLVAAWFLVAPHLGAFESGKIETWQDIWRPFWAMVLAGPLAAWLRGVWLNAPILPLFVVILGGVAALGLLAWRIIFILFARRKRRSYG